MSRKNWQWENLMASEVERTISEIEPGRLFLSGAPRSADALHKLGIKNVLNVAKEIHDECISYHADIKTVHFGFRDHIPMEPWMVRAALITLRSMLKKGPTLVHCGIGVSRSPTTIALYYYATGKFPSVQSAVQHLQTLRSCVAPNRIVDGNVMNVVEALRVKWTKTSDTLSESLT